MRYSIFILVFLVSFTGSAQLKKEKNSGLFYKISLSTTLTINESYTISTDDDERLIQPSAFFINNSLGYQFDERSSIAVNFQYDRHTKQGLNFFPAYLSFRYNIFDYDDPLFIRGGYGTLLNFSKKFETGNVYKLGAGTRIFDKDFRNSLLVGIDFTRKRFGYRTLNGLSSVSIFVEYQFF